MSETDDCIDRRKRRAFLIGDIEEQRVGAIIKGLYLMDSDNSEPIELFINSMGGSVYDMWALYDVTRTLISPIHTVALGSAQSAAILLVAAGEPGYRWAMPNTTFMSHQLSDNLRGRMDEIDREVRWNASFRQRWYTALERHTNRSAAWWKKEICKVGDFYYTAEKAVQIGVVDHLWNEKDA